MVSPRSRKILVVVFGIVSFVALFPLSVRIADPLFTHSFKPDWVYPILLVWSDHVEVRWVQSISEVSPRPSGETYTFNVSPERQAWVEAQVRKPDPDPESDIGLEIRIEQLGPDRQRIRLVSWGGPEFKGLIYEARPDEIVPLYSRAGDIITSPVLILGVHLLVWGILWFGVRRIWRLTARFRRHPAAAVVPPNVTH